MGNLMKKRGFSLKKIVTLLFAAVLTMSSFSIAIDAEAKTSSSKSSSKSSISISKPSSTKTSITKETKSSKPSLSKETKSTKPVIKSSLPKTSTPSLVKDSKTKTSTSKVKKSSSKSMSVKPSKKKHNEDCDADDLLEGDEDCYGIEIDSLTDTVNSKKSTDSVKSSNVTKDKVANKNSLGKKQWYWFFLGCFALMLLIIGATLITKNNKK